MQHIYVTLTSRLDLAITSIHIILCSMQRALFYRSVSLFSSRFWLPKVNFHIISNFKMKVAIRHHAELKKSDEKIKQTNKKGKISYLKFKERKCMKLLLWNRIDKFSRQVRLHPLTNVLFKSFRIFSVLQKKERNCRKYITDLTNFDGN